MYPIAVNLNGKRCLVVGGGRIAERRVESLREQGARIVLAAPEATATLQGLAASGAIDWHRKNYQNELLRGAFLVIAATDDQSVNAAVARDAQERDLLVCCAGEFEIGSFTTPAVVRRGDLVLTVSTGGSSPTLTALLRARLAAQFGPEWGALTALLGRLRAEVQQIDGDAARRSAVARVVDDPEIHHDMEQGRSSEAELRAQCLLSSSE